MRVKEKENGGKEGDLVGEVWKETEEWKTKGRVEKESLLDEGWGKLAWRRIGKKWVEGGRWEKMELSNE